MSNPGFEQFDSLCGAIAGLKDKKDEIKKTLAEVQKELDDKEAMALEWLTQLDRDSYQSKFGTVYKKRITSVSMPKDPVEREKFFKYLKERGSYDALVTINSRSLNAYYQSELELAAEQGNIDFAIPGLGEARVFEDTGFCRS